MSESPQFRFRLLIGAALPWPDRLGLAVRAPLGRALGSGHRGLFSRLGRRRLKKLASASEECVWRALNNRLGERLAVRFLMTTAPRWNTHATVFTTGPFILEGGDFSFDRTTLDASGRVWCLVVHRAEDGVTIARFSSTAADEPLDLPRGAYGAGLRIYEPAPSITLPALRTSQGTLTPTAQFQLADITRLEETVFHKTGPVYRLIHAPILQKLARAKDPTDRSVADAYLPVGNPETLFVFGHVPGAAAVTVDATALQAERALVYLTLYNTASFPVHSTAVAPGRTERAAASGSPRSLLLRIVPLSGRPDDHLDLLDAVRVEIG